MARVDLMKHLTHDQYESMLGTISRCSCESFRDDYHSMLSDARFAMKEDTMKEKNVHFEKRLATLATYREHNHHEAHHRACMLLAFELLIWLRDSNIDAKTQIHYAGLLLEELHHRDARPWPIP